MPPEAASPASTYLAFLREGKLAYQFSVDAGRAVFFPRLVCPYSGSERLEWRTSSGLGTVYSTTVVHGANGETHNVALVDVDEGFRLMTRVEDIAPRDVRIGMRVTFRPHLAEGDDPPYPVFVPCENVR